MPICKSIKGKKREMENKCFCVRFSKSSYQKMAFKNTLHAGSSHSKKRI